MINSRQMTFKKASFIFFLAFAGSCFGQNQILSNDTIAYSHELKPVTDELLRILALIENYPDTKKELIKILGNDDNHDDVHDNLCQAKGLMRKDTSGVTLEDFVFIRSQGYYQGEVYLSVYYQPEAYVPRKAEIVFDIRQRSNGFKIIRFRSLEDRTDSEWIENLIDSLD